MSTETPRTDRMIRRRDEIAACEVVAADLARTLERELTAVQQENERLREALPCVVWGQQYGLLKFIPFAHCKPLWKVSEWYLWKKLRQSLIFL